MRGRFGVAIRASPFERCHSTFRSTLPFERRAGLAPRRSVAIVSLANVVTDVGGQSSARGRERLHPLDVLRTRAGIRVFVRRTAGNCTRM